MDMRAILSSFFKKPEKTGFKLPVLGGVVRDKSVIMYVGPLYTSGAGYTNFRYRMDGDRDIQIHLGPKKEDESYAKYLEEYQQLCKLVTT